DDTIMGFGFPKEEREALVASEPDKFLMPRPSDMRYRWVCVRLNAIDVDELRELLVDAWRMCVPKKVAAAYEPEIGLPPRKRLRYPEPRVHAVLEAGHGADPVAGEGQDEQAGSVADAGRT